MEKLTYFQQLQQTYHKEIIGVMDFWTKYGVDREYGGYLTCLDREGKVFGTDKSGWFQGRGLYTFSKAYNSVEKRPEWLEAARLGYEFLKKHCYDNDKRMFFVLTRDGKPVQKRRYYFSECFAVTGCAEYFKASGDTEALELARDTFETIMYLYENPKVLPPKYNPEVVRTKSLNIPMIIIATAQVLCEADPENKAGYDEIVSRLFKEIVTDFLKEDAKALFETVGQNGERLDTPAGRTINPGHSIEASWFLMHEAILKGDIGLLEKSLDILNWSFEIGWDKQYGGLMYFMDIDGRPSDKLEWDMKLWWPHCEALIAFLMAYKATGDEKYLERFKQVHDYTFPHFKDKEFGEWYGYLHRDGSVSNHLKGNLFKGPFHIPRALILCDLMLKDICEYGVMGGSV